MPEEYFSLILRATISLFCCGVHDSFISDDPIVSPLNYQLIKNLELTVQAAWSTTRPTRL